MGCSLTPSSRYHCIQSYSIISSTVTLPPPKYISMAGKQDSTAKAIETNKWNPHSLCPEKHHCWSFHTYSVCVYGCVSDCTFLTLRYLAFPRRISVLTFYNGKSMCKAETLVEWYTCTHHPTCISLWSFFLHVWSHPLPPSLLFQIPCILHVSLKERYKLYLTCLVVILFTVVDVFVRHIVLNLFHFCKRIDLYLSLSLSLIICSPFRKRYAFCSYTYLMSRP